MFTKCYNGVEPLPNLMEVCKSLGMHRDAGAVFDGSLYIGYPYYTLPCLFKHQITECVKKNSVIEVLPHKIVLSETEGVSSSPLLITGPMGYLYMEGEEYPEGFFCSEYDSICTAAIAEKNGKLVWFSSPELLCSDYDISGDNMSLFLSAVAFLDGREAVPNISDINLAIDALVIPSQIKKTIFFIFLFFIPSAPFMLFLPRPVKVKKAKQRKSPV